LHKINAEEKIVTPLSKKEFYMKHTKIIITVVISIFCTATIAKRPDRPKKEFFKQDLAKHLVPKRGIQKKGPSETTVSRTGFLPKEKAPKRKSRRKR